MLKGFKMVELRNNAFNFCKFSLAGLLWLAVILRSEALLLGIIGLLAWSYAVRVERAPMIVLYTRLVELRWPSKSVMTDENSVAFAHLVGFIFATAAYGLVAFGFSTAGWVLAAVLALLKSSGACGYCGAMKLYSCMNHPSGTCCGMGKQARKLMDAEKRKSS